MLQNCVAIAVLAVSAYAAFECGTPAFPIVEYGYGKRIVGGWEAKPHSIPWQVYVMTFSSDVTYGACGGSLIQLTPGNGTDLVISAAHCVHQKETGYSSANKIKVVVGAHHLDATNEPSQKEIPIKNYKHHNYKSDTKENDIIVMKLKEVVPYTKYTRPVCLPKPGEQLPVGKRCMVSGWGTMWEGGTSTKLLRQVDIKVYSENECSIKPEMRKMMFCAGQPEGGKDSCQGDSGGPLVCNVNGKWTQFGVVSFGPGCARPHLPGVYVNLPQYVNWIKNKTNELKTAPDLSYGATSYSPYAPGSSGTTAPSVGSRRPTQIFDTYFLDTMAQFDSIFSKPFGSLFGPEGSLFPSGSSLFPHNKPFESVEIDSHFTSTGALKPGYSSSFGGLGSNFGSALLSGGSGFPSNSLLDNHEFDSFLKPSGSLKPGQFGSSFGFSPISRPASTSTAHTSSDIFSSSFGSSSISGKPTTWSTSSRPTVTTTTHTYSYSNGGKPVTSTSTTFGSSSLLNRFPSTFRRPMAGFSMF